MHTVSRLLGRQIRTWSAEASKPIPVGVCGPPGAGKSGVPGTYDLNLAQRVINDLLRRRPTRLPRFDKAKDDRLQERFWPYWSGPADVILLEGYWVGAKPQPEEAFDRPDECPRKRKGSRRVWRRFVNDGLGTAYQRLFAWIGWHFSRRLPSIQ